MHQESIRFHAHVAPQASLYFQPFPPRLFTVGSCLELFTELPSPHLNRQRSQKCNAFLMRIALWWKWGKIPHMTNSGLSFLWTRPQLMEINKRKKFGILCAVNWCHFIISTGNGNSWKLSNNVPLVRQQTQQKWVRSQDKCANSLFLLHALGW